MSPVEGADIPPELLARATDWPDHPVVCTFAFRLPFALRLPDGYEHKIELLADYLDSNEAALFPGRPFVRIRIHNASTEGLQMEPATTHAALQALYGEVDLPEHGPFGDAYEQWVSLETPSPLLQSERGDDPPYMFHRALSVFDLLLRSHNLVFRDAHVYPIATQDLGFVMFIGEYEPGGDEWTYKQWMMMHPERLPIFNQLETTFLTHRDALDWGLAEIANGNPFVRPVLLFLRADRAGRIRGDLTEHVIALQTTVEGRLYATWRVLLVDKGLASADIENEIGSDTPYKSLVVTVLPRLLGGRWDVTAPGTPVGEYWTALYELRNRIVHAGYEPLLFEAEKAKTAYDHLRVFVRERVWERRRDYPRTAIAIFGRAHIRNQLPPDEPFRQSVDTIVAERTPLFLPWDVAGRSRP